jgi:hypothetical protein
LNARDGDRYLILRGLALTTQKIEAYDVVPQRWLKVAQCRELAAHRRSRSPEGRGKLYLCGNRPEQSGGCRHRPRPTCRMRKGWAAAVKRGA